MITNFFIPELNNHDVQELWFQQDGAACHTARATIDLLKDTYGDRLISRFGPVNWPPRSCDLTPLDYFLWGYVKSLVYADKPQTLDHLEDNIRRVIPDIRPQMLEKVIENWTSRLDHIRASRGSPMPEIIFKIEGMESAKDDERSGRSQIFLPVKTSKSFLRRCSDQEDHEERGSKDRAASTCGPHSDSFNDTSSRRRIAIVPQTISKHLAEANLKSKCPFRVLPLTPKHRQLRLQWCQARSMWNVTDWQKVVLSDESRFVLGTDDNRVRVWRRPGERQDPPPPLFLCPTAHTAGVMVWGAIAYDSRSTLIVMRGTLTGQR
ncbi:hypothetical protein TNCV_1444891 [Trichonephila clavipes]|nr:hypothetical protein TNCV_1444891 [Trichonephila clavipes]